jgi:hypothetical protein
MIKVGSLQNVNNIIKETNTQNACYFPDNYDLIGKAIIHFFPKCGAKDIILVLLNHYS